METRKLTKLQLSFMSGYLGCLDEETMNMLVNEDESGFVKRVSRSDFDDGEETPQRFRTAASGLNKIGFFDDMDVHADLCGGKHLYVSFSEKGAKMIYQIGREAVTAGRAIIGPV